ncbi:MAG: NAD(P)H-dependent oxidoreductase [Burkholderiales bacterium]|nr:NAD(P)H-dependent oxidoreductase [Burkholderiales bacterium]
MASKFAIISGSTRHNAPQSSKVAHYVKWQLEEKLKQKTYLLDLAKTELKYWDETFWSDYANFDKNWSIASSEIRSSDAIIIIAPEWNGTIPPALKNIFHLATKGEMANKPGLIISVSSAQNGVYPIIELRSSGYKNNFINYIPQHVIVRNVNSVLNNPEAIETEEDKLIKERLDYTLKVLQVYAEAFVNIRNSDIIKNIPFPYGM